VLQTPRAARFSSVLQTPRAATADGTAPPAPVPPNLRNVNGAAPNAASQAQLPRAAPAAAAHHHAQPHAGAPALARPVATAPVHVPISFPPARSEELFDWIGAASEDLQGRVVDFLQSLGHALTGDDGEVELDPELLPPQVLWQLDDFCQRHSRGTYVPRTLA
jgi:Bromodomain extra-terminal - transcription regulation